MGRGYFDKPGAVGTATQIYTRRYRQLFTCRGIAAQQLRWAYDVYMWWKDKQPLSQLPKQPANMKRERRGEKWRRDQRGWVADAKAKNARPK